MDGNDEIFLIVSLQYSRFAISILSIHSVSSFRIVSAIVAATAKLDTFCALKATKNKDGNIKQAMTCKIGHGCHLFVFSKWNL